MKLSKGIIFVLALVSGAFAGFLSWGALNDINRASAEGNIYMEQWFRFRDGVWQEDVLLPRDDARFEQYVGDTLANDETTQSCPAIEISFPSRGFRILCEDRDIARAGEALDSALEKVAAIYEEMTEARLETIAILKQASQKQLEEDLAGSVAGAIAVLKTQQDTSMQSLGQDAVGAVTYGFSKAFLEAFGRSNFLDISWPGVKVREAYVDRGRITYDAARPQFQITALSMIVGFAVFLSVAVILGVLRFTAQQRS